MDNQENESKLRPHSVDGIEEYDNPMPKWWLGLFYFTIIFGVFYLAYYHGFGGQTIEDEYAAQVAAEALQVAEKPGSSSSKDLDDPELIAAGKTLYATNCTPCHGAMGEGLVGPNLTDPYWMYGGSPEQVVKSIGEGIPAKGMMAWLPILGPEKVDQLAAYVLSLQGSSPDGGKPPQGDLYEQQ